MVLGGSSEHLVVLSTRYGYLAATVPVEHLTVILRRDANTKGWSYPHRASSPRGLSNQRSSPR